MKVRANCGRILQGTAYMIFFAYIVFLLILNLYSVFNGHAIKYTIIVLPMILFCLFINGQMKISSSAFFFTLFLAAYLLKGIMVLCTDTKPVSDFLTFYQCAEKLVHGNKEWGKWSYFNIWAYQTGPIAYYAILMKIFGTGLLPLKLCNCFFMAGTNVLIYLIAKKITSETAARGAALLYLFYPAPYFLAPVLTNQHFAAFMLIAAVYVLLMDGLNLILKGGLAGLLLAVGNVVRPIGIVIIMAYTAWVIAEIVRIRKIHFTRTLAAFLVSYFVLFWTFSAVFVSSGISPNGLKNNFPLWKFVIGLNQETAGQFSYKDQNETFVIQDSEKRNEAALRAIKQRLDSPPLKMAKFLIKKQYTMWASKDTLRWAFYVYKDKNLVPPAGFERYELRAEKLEKIYYLAVFIILLTGLSSRVRQMKNINPGAFLPILILIVYFAIHILIEVQVRYRYFAMIIVFILASWGVESISEVIKLQIKNKIKLHA